MALLPVLELSAPAEVVKDGVATINVTMKSGGAVLPYSGEITVDAVSGYAPKTRVKLSNGFASFKVVALALDAGDELRVKVGLRTVTGLGDKTLKVVAAA